MAQFFYSQFQDGETLSPEEKPTQRYTGCPICAAALAMYPLLGEFRCHEMSYEIGVCRACGWWDMVYREWGMMGEPEEFTYLHAILRDFRSLNFSSGAARDELVRLKSDPEQLYQLSPRRLELLVSDLMATVFNCQVGITKQSRDGGKDIIGFDSDRGPFLVEVKRYKKWRKVGIEIVRQLVGTMFFEGVHRGFVVSTSSFTAGARSISRSLKARHGWDLELKDFRDICTWLALYRHPLIDYTELEEKLDARLYSFPRGALVSALSPAAC
jgi:hypothetical protein